MLKGKSDRESEFNRNAGNYFYNDVGVKFMTLAYYNAAIVQAESKRNLALAYANRSAVYLDLKKYEECLENIQWARENDYPADKIQKLNEREKKCKELMAKEVKDPADDPWEVFKLSYPVNTKIPFIVDCLELRTVNNEPRLVTTRDLKPGDIIFEEEMTFTRNFSSAMHIHCCHCCKANNSNLIPCLKTGNLMFCSLKCRNHFYEVYGDDLTGMLVHNEDVKVLNTDRLIRQIEHAFGGHDALLEFLMENDLKKLKKTIFDFDWRENPEKIKIICCLSLDTAMKKNFPFDLTPVSYKVSRGHPEFKDLRKKLLKIFKIYGTRVFDTSNNKLDEEFFGITMFYANVRSSCMPNMNIEIVENKAVGYITKPIKAGQEILFSKSFLAFHPDALQLRASPNKIKCHPDCYGCKNNIHCSNFEYRNLFETQIALMKSKDLVMVKELKECVERNWKIIAKYENDPLSKDAAELQWINCSMMKKLAIDVTITFDQDLLNKVKNEAKNYN